MVVSRIFQPLALACIITVAAISLVQAQECARGSYVAAAAARVSQTTMVGPNVRVGYRDFGVAAEHLRDPNNTDNYHSAVEAYFAFWSPPESNVSFCAKAGITRGTTNRRVPEGSSRSGTAYLAGIAGTMKLRDEGPLRIYFGSSLELWDHNYKLSMSGAEDVNTSGIEAGSSVFATVRYRRIGVFARFVSGTAGAVLQPKSEIAAGFYFWDGEWIPPNKRVKLAGKTLQAIVARRRIGSFALLLR
jgi:hypothetical protein